MLAVAAHGYWQVTPQDVVSAVRAGDVDELGKAVFRNPAAVHTKVYPRPTNASPSARNTSPTMGRAPGKAAI